MLFHLIPVRELGGVACFLCVGACLYDCKRFVCDPTSRSNTYVYRLSVSIRIKEAARMIAENLLQCSPSARNSVFLFLPYSPEFCILLFLAMKQRYTPSLSLRLPGDVSTCHGRSAFYFPRDVLAFLIGVVASEYIYMRVESLM